MVVVVLVDVTEVENEVAVVDDVVDTVVVVVGLYVVDVLKVGVVIVIAGPILELPMA